MRHSGNRHLSAFTLVELLVVLALVALIAQVGMSSLSALVSRADAVLQRESLVRQVAVFTRQLQFDLDSVERHRGDFAPVMLETRMALLRRYSQPINGVPKWRVVVWLDDGRSVYRWQSAPIGMNDPVTPQWDFAMKMLATGQLPDGVGQLNSFEGISGLLIRVFIEDAWSNPLSTLVQRETDSGVSSVQRVTPRGLELTFLSTESAQARGRHRWLWKRTLSP